MSLKIGGLFAGYGGLDLAIEEVFNAELAWYAEFDPAPSKIMAHHYPHLTNYGDVTAVDWSSVPPVDIISGGSPCQDLSLAGARKGMNTGTRSNLWESMREAIATIKPTYVVWENVRGALSATATSVSDMGQREGFLDQRGGHLRALGRVLGDLASLGYDCQWRGLRAADVGAPHGRFRVFILATLRDSPLRGRDNARPARPREHQGRECAGATGGPSEPTAADTDSRDDAGREQDQERGAQWGVTTERSGGSRNGGEASANTASNGRHEGRAKPARIQWGHDAAERSPSDIDWGPYTPAIRRWEAVRGAAPAPTELTAKGNHRLSARFAEWMMGVPDGWIVDVPGITRNEALKAAGNGVVPQQAAAALRDMLNQQENQ